MNLRDYAPSPCEAALIGCVLVLYHPEGYVVDTIRRLASRGYRVCVVVNSADDALIHTLVADIDVHVINNPCNIGLAAALNQGITSAFQDPVVRFVTLFDQDSLPDDDLPLNLAAELLSMHSESIACIGPCLQDKKALDLAIKTANIASAPDDVLSIPTSGTLIPRSAYNRVGLMKTAFFIDGIDHEWCFQAKKIGLRVLQSAQTTMIHNMGDAAVNWFGRFKPVHHSPLRHYYIVRNHLDLILRGPAPFLWRCKEAMKQLRRIVVYPCVSNYPIQSARLIFWAVFDGITERLGECTRFPAKKH